MNRFPRTYILGLALLLASTSVWADLTVFAAASLTNALTDIAKSFEKEHNVSVKLSFAASSALAKQIEQGAPADLFVSADIQWVDYLEGKGLIDPALRRNLLGNTLVLIAPHGSKLKVAMNKDFDFAGAFAGKLCTGMVESVPVGRYAGEALAKLGWWDAIRTRLVGTEDVRAALNLVERDECEAGIVYETDAKQSKKVIVVGRFPADTHAPITYPAALVSKSGEARMLFDYLGGKAATDVFTRYGFQVLTP